MSAQTWRRHQPAKLAAMEAHFETDARRAARASAACPTTTSGARRATRIEIPHGLSLLAFHDPNAEVNGLDALPAGRMAAGADRAPRVPARWSALGTFMALVCAGAVAARGWRQRDVATHRWLLLARRRCRGAAWDFSRIEAGWIGDGSRPAALDHLRRPAHRRRGDADAGPHRAVPHLHAALLLPRHHRRAAAVPADAAEPAPRTRASRTRRTPHDVHARPHRRGPRGASRSTRTSCFARRRLRRRRLGPLRASAPRQAQQRTLIATPSARSGKRTTSGSFSWSCSSSSAFPRLRAIAILLHIPLTLMLLGIVLRGSAFIFAPTAASATRRSSAGGACSRSRASPRPCSSACAWAPSRRAPLARPRCRGQARSSTSSSGRG